LVLVPILACVRSSEIGAGCRVQGAGAGAGAGTKRECKKTCFDFDDEMMIMSMEYEWLMHY
jgi:hypothetical protein